jgi:membrane protease YdiL (CAAX protease family)
MLMLAVGVIWRIIDVMVLDLGATWLNIMPSKIGPLLVMLFVLAELYGNQKARDVLGLRSNSFRTQLLIGVLLGLSFYFFVDVAGSVVYHFMINASYSLALSIVNPGLLWYAFIFFFVNAVYEETLFRGLLQNSFKARVGAKWAILSSAIIFGVWHAVWPVINGAGLSEFISMVFLSGMLGAFFGIYYEKFSSGKTLYGTITCHTLINFLNENFKIGAAASTQGPDFTFSDPTFMLISVLIFFGMMFFYYLFSWKWRVEQAESFGLRMKSRFLMLFTGHES